MQTNATHSLFYVSSLNGDSNNGFAFGTAASFAGFLAADEKFIDFNTAGKFFTILANSAASQFLQPTPSGAVAAKTQKFFEIYCIDP